MAGHAPGHGDFRLRTDDVVESVVGAGTLARLLVGLPRIEVRVTDLPAGREIAAFLRTRTFAISYHRIAQGVLCLPDRPADYLRGRSRQAVRTNLHKADAARLQCRAVVDRDERRDIATALGMGTEATALADERDDVVWAAIGPGEESLGLLWATVDAEWAMLRNLSARPAEARYLLHTALVRHLYCRGVRYLFAQGGNALSLAPGLQYFQKLLGYRVANLRAPSAGQLPRSVPRGGAPRFRLV